MLRRRRGGLGWPRVEKGEGRAVPAPCLEGDGEGYAGSVLRRGRGGLCRPRVEKEEVRALPAPC